MWNTFYSYIFFYILYNILLVLIAYVKMLKAVFKAILFF